MGADGCATNNLRPELWEERYLSDYVVTCQEHYQAVYAYA